MLHLIRIITLLMVGLSVCFKAWNQGVNSSDLQKMGLKGAVSILEKRRWEAAEKFGTIEKAKYYSGRIYQFEKNGHIKSSTSVEENNDIFEKTINFRESSGKIKESKAYGYQGNLKHYTIYKYRNNGTLLESLTFENDGTLFSSNKYNELELDIETKIYYSKERNSVYAEYSIYDATGKETYRKRTDIVNGRETGTIEYFTKYNDQGFKIEYVIKSTPDTNITSYTYDSFGRITEERSYKNGSFEYKKLFKYNQQGDEIEYISYDKNNEVIQKKSYQYEYDNKGNWVKQITFESKSEEFQGVPRYIDERKIEYYN